MRLDSSKEVRECKVPDAKLFAGCLHYWLDLVESGVDESWEEMVLNLKIESTRNVLPEWIINTEVRTVLNLYNTPVVLINIHEVTSLSLLSPMVDSEEVGIPTTEDKVTDPPSEVDLCETVEIPWDEEQGGKGP